MNSYTRIQKTAAITVFNSGGQENANDKIGVGNGNGQGRNNGQGTENALETVAEIITTTEKYVYDGANVIVDYDENNVVKATYVTPFLDQNLIMVRGDNTYYYTQDGLGSVREVLDANQVVKNSYDYYAFGEALNWSETIENRYTFTAREWDKESQTNYFRSRNQDPRTGRFLSADPIGYSGGINLYGYVANNPIMRNDSFGLQWEGLDYFVEGFLHWYSKDWMGPPKPSKTKGPILWDESVEVSRTQKEWKFRSVVPGEFRAGADSLGLGFGYVTCNYEAEVKLTCECKCFSVEGNVRAQETKVIETTMTGSLRSNLARIGREFQLREIPIFDYYVIPAGSMMTIEPSDMSEAIKLCKDKKTKKMIGNIKTQGSCNDFLKDQ